MDRKFKWIEFGGGHPRFRPAFMIKEEELEEHRGNYNNLGAFTHHFPSPFALRPGPRSFARSIHVNWANSFWREQK